MANTYQKRISLSGIFLLCTITALTAQNIFSGGNNDGFAKATYSEPDPSTDIYSGGMNDGFAMNLYSEPDPAHDIYQGGIQDGFALSFYSESSPADIYRGGFNDGFAFNAYEELGPGFAKAFFSEDVLPVEWRYFTITKKNGKPFLQWSADKEEKCLSYEVLRSSDGKNFEAIAEMPCQGDAIDNDYEFEDVSPIWHRIYYYKIAQYDVDGEFTYSPVKAFNATSPSEPEVFYKNAQLIVKTDREIKLRSVSVFDFTGRTLCRQFADEHDGYYTIDCQLTSNQLVIIQMTFDSFTHSTYMRMGE
jgi:hypothetical protein